MTVPTAKHVMSRPIRRLQANVTMREAAAFLLRLGISGAVVVDAHGRPAGVFSLRDIAAYVQQRVAHLPEIDARKERARDTGEMIPAGKGFHFENIDDVRVSDVMTPGIITVSPGASLGTIARLMTQWKVHRVFVEGGPSVAASFVRAGFADEFLVYIAPALIGGDMLAAAYSRISAQPGFGQGATREVWNLKNGGGGWDHPVHIHFEEGQILKRDGSFNNVPLAERGRKDVYRLRPGGEVQITMQFRDWQGMFMQHCHNTVHEDHAMLMRWEINDGGEPFLRPLPTPISRPQGYVFRAPDEILRDD